MSPPCRNRLTRPEPGKLNSPVNIRAATSDDFEAIWPIFQAVVAAGDTYGYRPDTSKEEAFRLWMESPRQTYVVEVDGQILGTY